LPIDKLDGKNYTTRESDVKLWLENQGYLDHLTLKVTDVAPDHVNLPMIHLFLPMILLFWHLNVMIATAHASQKNGVTSVSIVVSSTTTLIGVTP